jgi:Tol biopolymer transport system component
MSRTTIGRISRRSAMLSASLVAGLGGAALAETATASATFPGKNGQIAVVVTDPHDAARATNVLTMSHRGSHRELITHTRAGHEAGPTNVAFSADGRRMVFDRRVCHDVCHSNVGVMRSDGSHVRLVTTRRHGFDTNFGFTTDGSLVGFTRDAREILVAGAKRGHAKRLARYAPGVAITSASFSPDGESVVFGKFESSYEDGTSSTSERVCVIAIASREETCLAEGSTPRWAPNGRSILFTGPGYSGIHRMRPDGSHERVLIAGDARMRPLDFAPNGRHFAFLREVSSGTKIYVAKWDGTHRRTISHDRKFFENSFDVAFSPDSKQVIYRRGTRKSFYVSRIDGSHDKGIRVTPRRLEGPSGSLAWAPRR